MAYSIKVERVGTEGVPIGPTDLYEAPDEADAITIAAFAVDLNRASERRVATVRDAAGRLIVSYAGRSIDPGR